MPDLARRRVGLALLSVPAILAACGSREPAPTFEYTLLDGVRRRSDSLRGKVVLVNFWATSCQPCLAEMPRLVATHERFRGRDFETLAVAMSYDPPAAVSDYAQTRRLPFGVVIDNTGAIARRFGDVQATPTTFVIDKHGRVARRVLGEPDFAALDRVIDGLLAES